MARFLQHFFAVKVQPFFNMKPKYSKCLSFCLWLCAGAVCQADVIANTFGPNDGYDETRIYPVYWNVMTPGNSANVASSVAVGFTVSNGPFSLNSVTLALGQGTGYTNNLAISLLADNSGAPGALLENIVSHPVDATNFYAVLTYQSSLHPILAEGFKYWLLLEPTDHNLVDRQNNSDYSWAGSYGASLGAVAYRQFNFNSGDWDNWQLYNTFLPAFRIEGLSVPEPSSGSLILLATIFAWRRLPCPSKRKRQTTHRLT
jgi:hypothetical protein